MVSKLSPTIGNKPSYPDRKRCEQYNNMLMIFSQRFWAIKSYSEKKTENKLDCLEKPSHPRDL